MFHRNPMSQSCSGWSNRELQSLNKYKSQLFDVQQQLTAQRIMKKQTNQINFYKITPKEQLPKSLQKMSFQTLNSKEMNVGTIVKVFRKEKLGDKQVRIRRRLKQNGEIMLLSEIYDYLDDPLDKQDSEKKQKKEVVPLSNVINQLDEWEKVSSKKGTLEARFSKNRYPSNILTQEQRRNSGHKKEFMVKKFKIGSNYRVEVERNLQVIYNSHNNESNLMTKHVLIENSSKLLKKELEEMKEIIQKEIEQKMKKMTESRKEHHRLFEQKSRLQLQEQQLDEEKAKQELVLQGSTYNYHALNQNAIKTVYEDKRAQIEKNEAKIVKIKKTIQFLEDETFKNEQQLKNIIAAEIAYYRISLRNGVDSRDTGLVWIIKKLGALEQDMSHIEFPEYLDKKSRQYLISKATNEESLEQLLKQKREFVNEIGKEGSQQQTAPRRSSISSRKSSIKLEKPYSKGEPLQDGIKQVISTGDSDIPKRYSRSAKKITALRQQYIKNENLLKMTQSRSGLKFGYNLAGLTGRQIYNSIADKIKQVDFSKLKKEKIQEKSDKIYEYQTILRRIQDLHMQMEEQDLQHESYLLSQFRDNKDIFFTTAAACFGVKRAYSLIIKNFSWKSTL